MIYIVSLEIINKLFLGDLVDRGEGFWGIKKGQVECLPG